MDQAKLERKLGKKVPLSGMALSQVLTEEEMALVSFWTHLENRATDWKARRKKEPERYPGLTDQAIDQEMEEEGQRILDQFKGDARRALASLV